MKTEEDEAFDEIARKQGHWGGGFMVKRAMAADKLQEPAQERCCYHDSDCAVHNMPAYPAGPCDCTQQFKFWSVTGKYERQAFACLSNAEAYCKGLNATYPEGNYIVSPLYTTLPQREWVGLTDEEVDFVFQMSTYETEPARRFNPERFAYAIEQSLKEKNNGT